MTKGYIVCLSDNKFMATKKAGTKKKNKAGVKNSLVNNINARKKKGKSRSKKRSTISKNAYDQMSQVRIV